MTAGNGRAPVSPEGETTVHELLARIDGATAGMSQHNPNRILLQQCRVAIIWLAERVPDAAVVTRSGIILP